jgi:hypothetical protein
MGAGRADGGSAGRCGSARTVPTPLGDLDPIGTCVTTTLDRVGERASGRDLGGRTWDQYPIAEHR